MPLSHQARLKATSSSSLEGSNLSSQSSQSEHEDVPELKPFPKTYAPLACYDPTMAVPFDMSILTISHKRGHSTIKAVIVGGGICGLAMAIMMHHAGMDFDILERSTGNEPTMGSAISLGPSVLRLFEQMGLLPKIEQFSKVIKGITVFDSQNNLMGRVDGVEEDRYGYCMRVMSREALHKILLDNIPKTNLHRGKLVVETLQNANGVSCKCSDGSTYYGDIIVGADGSQSLTRENMYIQLAEQSKLPEGDILPSEFQHQSCGGISNPLSAGLVSAAHDQAAEIRVIYNKDSSNSFWYLPIAGNRVAWGISSTTKTKTYYHAYSKNVSNFQCIYLGTPLPVPEALAADSTRSIASRVSPSSQLHTDWFVPANIDLEEKFKDLLDKQCAIGAGTVRDFIALTPKEAISVIDVEERLYETWYHERIVLIGDACHQHSSIGGQSPTQGILDAVCLVNLLYEMDSSSPIEITEVFRKYQHKRSLGVKSSIEETSQIDKIFHKQGFVSDIMRKFMLNSIWSFNMTNDKLNKNRPQLLFLPFVDDRGKTKAKPQKRSKKLAGNKCLYV
ncbi:hypothetical protein BGX26_003314 [Mortierella sp. AD094]|nr:hypothetical protein BGX26_003314 [Mortierella sp. AD094]